jgi:mono/diheme cytochrome c family protein
MKRWAIIAAAVLVGAALRWHAAPPAPRPILAAAQANAATPEARGQAVYARYGCAMCHGEDGTGGFANPNAETEERVPAVIYVAEGYTEAELRQVVLDGTPYIGKADPAGQVPPFRMPGMRGAIAESELDDLIRYLMSLYPESAQESWR